MIGFFNNKKENNLDWNIFFGSHSYDPRKISPTVKGIGKESFTQIVNLFSSRKKEVEKKIIVFYSTTSGVGKSHLVGRLFQYFSPNFFLVSIPPLFSPFGFFQYLRQCIYNELLFPEKSGSTGCWPGQANQLDVLTYGILLELVNEAAQKNKSLYRKIRSAIVFLKKNPTSLLPEEVVPEWVEWLKRDFPFVLPLLEKELTRWGAFANDPRDWIKVIYGFSVLRQDRRITEMCKNWFFGEPFVSPEPSFIDIPSKPLQIDKEEEAKLKIKDLFYLSSKVRPFLVVFDHWDPLLSSESWLDRFLCFLSELLSFPNRFLLIVGTEPLLKALQTSSQICPHLLTVRMEAPTKEDLVAVGCSRLTMIKGLKKEKKMAIEQLYRNYEGATAFHAFFEFGYNKILSQLKNPQISAMPFFETVLLEAKLAIELNPRLLPFQAPMIWFLTTAARTISWITVANLEQPYFDLCWTVHSHLYWLSLEPFPYFLTEAFLSEVNKKKIDSNLSLICFLPPTIPPTFHSKLKQAKDLPVQFHLVAFEQFTEISALYLLFITAYQDTLFEQSGIKEKMETLARYLISKQDPLINPSYEEELQQTCYEIVRDTIRDKKSVGFSSLQESLPLKLTRKDILRAAGFSPEILVVPSLSGLPHFLWIH
ncbi:hypothetical protein A7Q09_04810 [Methylacidiphilum sp. Yel]|uniref:ATP-binding protein n=1 Tax=Methylacidiphilum sp. Yel TaxID=1847730 RepID=UPI00106B14CE|nr:ATP-binding protein [Methylacidiphilum sp. Yel]TFE69759.1 hypothetical protein A7Q09_04810 [Methylacidiphilum sp. Yel]